MKNKNTLFLALICFAVLIMGSIAVAKVNKTEIRADVVDKWITDPGEMKITNGMTIHVRGQEAVLEYVCDDPILNGLNYVSFNANIDIDGVGTISGTYHFVAGNVVGNPGQKFVENVIGIWDGVWSIKNYGITLDPYFPSGGQLYTYEGGGTGRGSEGFEGMKINFELDTDDIGEFCLIKSIVQNSSK